MRDSVDGREKMEDLRIIQREERRAAKERSRGGEAG